MASARGWLTDATFAGGLQTAGIQTEHVAHGAVNVVELHDATGRTEHVQQGSVGQLQIDRPLKRTAGCLQPMDGSRQLAGISVQPIGDQRPHVMRARRPPGDWTGCSRMPKRVARSAGSIPHTSPPEKRVVSTGPNFASSAGGRSAANTSCRRFAQQRIHRVLQLDQRGPLAQEELHVVDQQQIDVPILVAEAGQTAAAQRIEEHRGELLGRQVQHAARRAMPANRGPDTLEQVRLATTGWPEQKQG